MSQLLNRSYATTHPWITFRADLRAAGPNLWMLFGESRSKVDHLSRALLKPETALEMNLVYLAKGAHATTAIEGNTLSEQQVLDIVEGRHVTTPSQDYLVKEIQNIVDAYNRIKNELFVGASPELTVEQMMRFNAEVLLDLVLDEGVVPGEIRQHDVGVARYRGAPWQDCEFLVGRLCEWLNGTDFEPPDDSWQVPWALVKAILAHLYVAWIHPFGDGNGRTARLIELQILLGAGLPMPATHLLSNHYNQTRAEYYRQLDRASRSGGDIIPFLEYALQGFVDGIRGQIERVWQQQFADRWEQLIYQTFGEAHTPAKERQRRLVLELSKQTGHVSRRDLPGMSPELTRAYDGTERTLSRDLNALLKLGLIGRVPGGYVPLREQLLGFQPLRRAIRSE